MSIDEDQGRGKPKNAEDEELLHWRMARDRRVAIAISLAVAIVLALVAWLR